MSALEALDDSKALATLQAEFALAGHAMTWHFRDDGSMTILVSRWAFTREFNSIEEARQFLLQVAGLRHVDPA